MNWYRLSIAETFELLDTRQQGLSTRDAEIKQLRYGLNELLEGKKKNIALMSLTQFKDVMILILLVAAIISGISVTLQIQLLFLLLFC